MNIKPSLNKRRIDIDKAIFHVENLYYEDNSNYLQDILNKLKKYKQGLYDHKLSSCETKVTYYHATIFINGTEKIYLPSLVKNIKCDYKEGWIEITTRSGAVIEYVGLPFIVYKMGLSETHDLIHVDAIFNQNFIKSGNPCK